MRLGNYRTRKRLGPPTQVERAGAFSLVEVMIAVLVLAVLSSAYYAGLSSGFGFIKSSREDVRATQILTQQLEAVRLCTWSELRNYSFQQVYDPLSSVTQARGVTYFGTVSIGNASAIPNSASYAPDMRLVTVTLSWTNLNGTMPIAHTRQMQTQVARYGLQSYIWGAIQ